MGLKRLLKERIILSSINKKRKKKPLDLDSYEKYSLPVNAHYVDINSYYFASNTKDKGFYFRIAYRGEGFTECWFSFYANNKLYYLPKLSDIYQKDDLDIELLCVSLQKEWRVRFKAKVIEISKPTIEHELKLEFTFKSNSDIFEFSYHIDPLVIARSLSRVPWNKEFKKANTASSQVHYEQLGMSDISITIGSNSFKYKAPMIRDHSFGKRSWRNMNRHIWCSAVISEHESLNFNYVDYPYMPDIMTGYYEKNGLITNVKEVIMEEDDLFIGETPSSFKARVILVDLREFIVFGKRMQQLQYSFENGVYNLFEGVGSYLINEKIRGYGIMEFGFNKDKSRWKNDYK